MAKNLTNSYEYRQKILNDSYIFAKIEEYPFFLHYGMKRISYNGELLFSKRHLEYLLNTSISIINKCIRDNQQELKASGYIYEKNPELQAELKTLDPRFTKSIELFSFKALLNMAMLIPDNEITRFLRSRILDIIIDSIAETEGCRVKYLNQSRQYDYTLEAATYYSRSQDLYDAIKDCLEERENWNDINKIFENLNLASKKEVRQFKSDYKSNRYNIYSVYDEIYRLIFSEKGKRYIHESYRQILEKNTRFDCINKAKRRIEAGLGRSNPSSVSRIRLGLYAEVMSIIRKIEDIVAAKMRLLSKQQGKRITVQELDEIVLNLESDLQAKILIQKARTKITWRDLPCSEIFHKKLKDHNKTISETNLDIFIEEKNKSVKEKLSKPEILSVFQRLQER